MDDGEQMRKCHSRECGKRAHWTQMARTSRTGLPSSGEHNRTSCMSVANGICVSLVEVGLRVLPIKTLPFYAFVAQFGSARDL